MEQIPNESLKIKTGDGSLFVFQINEVSRITKEEVSESDEGSKKAKAEKTISRFHRTSGYVGKVETAFGGGRLGPSTGVYTTHGARVGSRVFFGGGVGVEVGDDGFGFVPVYSNVRFDFVDTRLTPYIDIRLGAGFGDGVGLYGGFGTGVRIALTPKLALNAGFIADGAIDESGLVGFNIGFEF